MKKKIGLMALVLSMALLSGCGSSSSNDLALLAAAHAAAQNDAQNDAIDKIADYAEDDETPPTAEDYEAAGVEGVTTDKIDEMNEVVAGLTYEEVDTEEEIQDIADDLGITISSIESGDIPKYIPDVAPDWRTQGEVNSTIDVNGLNDVQIKKITVTLDINHTSVNDLTIYLYSPTKSIVLSDRNGDCREADYNNTIFDDAADKSITNTDYSPPYNGSYRPEEALSTFNGEAPDGIWTLKIVDNAANDTGTLNSWSITIE